MDSPTSPVENTTALKRVFSPLLTRTTRLSLLLFTAERILGSEGSKTVLGTPDTDRDIRGMEGFSADRNIRGRRELSADRGIRGKEFSVF